MECEKDYQLVVANPSFNHNPELIKLPRTDKIELIVNSPCFDNCSRQELHYKTLSRQILLFSGNSDFSPCAAIRENAYDIIKKRKSFIDNHFIDSELVPHGIENYKIEGRTANEINLIEFYVYYFIREEFKEVARNDLLIQSSAFL